MRANLCHRPDNEIKTNMSVMTIALTCPRPPSVPHISGDWKRKAKRKKKKKKGDGGRGGDMEDDVVMSALPIGKENLPQFA